MANPDGDSGSAIAAVFFAHRSAMQAVASRLLGSATDAEDAVQEVFLRIWQHRDTFSAERLTTSYLLHAARNKALHVLARRQTARRLAVQLADLRCTDFPMAVDPEDIDTTIMLAELAAQLPSRCNQVFILVVSSELSHAEAARRLEISEKAVEKQMARARRLLRRLLSNSGPSSHCGRR